ncbi:MAG: TIGR03545 family protein [Gammaproteobacteria bacterium]|nr:TIGR03545 family protein [Gammaproteobacteria bacterium]
MKSIRWGGLIAIVVMLLLLTTTLLFAGRFIKPLIESGLTDMNGAKVDIEEVKISYTPFMIEINNIQIADPEQAMVNTAQIDKVKFALSLGHMLLGKLVIDEASITDIQVNTARHKSGLIEKIAKEDSSKDDSEGNDNITMPEIDLPDIEDVLAVEPLISDKLISELEDDLSKTDKKWQEISKVLPNKAMTDKYEARFKKIQNDVKGNTSQKLAAIKDAKQLSDDLKAEVERIKQAKQQFGADLDRLSEELKAAKDAPALDIARIKNKYKLDNLNAENISQILFGDQVSGYTALARKWYKRIAPYLDNKEAKKSPEIERSKGVDIVFNELNPMPDLYVRKTMITANLPRGQFEGIVTAMSSNQAINKEPMRLRLRGVSLVNKESEEISGEFNYVEKTNGFSRFKYMIVKSKIDDFVVSRSSKLPLTMKRALMDFNLDAKLQHGSLQGTAKIQFNHVSFDSGSSSSLLASSFKGVKAFNLDGHFSGSMSDLSIKLSSDLDNQLGKELKNKLNQKKLEFENELKIRINEKLKQSIARIESRKEKLDVIKNKVDGNEKQLQQRLAALRDTINAEQDLKKKETTDKLKDKLKSKFGL